MQRLGIDRERLWLGVGAGFSERPLTRMREALPALREHLDAAGVAAWVAGRAELVVEEIAMNVALHSGLPEGERRVALRAEPGPDGGCSLVFEDRGRPFDSAAASLPDPAQRLAAGVVGGLGLVLVRRLAAEVRYERLPDGRNCLHVGLRGDG